MQTENLKSFFVWYVITCHLTTYRASRNRFSVISFRDYLRYFGIFLAHYFMKIDRFIFKSSHSFLTLRTSWLVWCLYRYYQGIFQNSASNRESWSWKSDCVTLGELEDDMLSHTRRKNSLDSQSQFWTHSAVCSGLIRHFRSFPR